MPCLERVDDAPKDSERKAIAHCIRDARTPFLRMEGVSVVPQTIRSGQLRVDETLRRLPLTNLRRPPERNAVPAELVTDLCAFGEADRLLTQNAEVQPGRCNRLEVARIGKKCKHLVHRSRNPLTGAKGAKADQGETPDLKDAGNDKHRSTKKVVRSQEDRIFQHIYRHSV